MDVFEIPEDIDLMVDQGEIDLIRSDLTVLDRYYSDIARVGAVSRDQAKTLVSDCGVQFDERYPMNTFTDQPSAVNVTLTMEGMASSIVRMLWEMIKKAAAILAKIARWIMEVVRRALGFRKDSEKGLTATLAIKAAVTRLENMIPEIQDTPAILSAKRHLEEMSVNYSGNYNDLVADMLTDETFSSVVRYVGLDLLQFHEVIEMKMRLYRDLIRSPQLNQNDLASNTSLMAQLRTIAEPIQGQRIQEYLKTAGVDTRSNTLFDALTGLRQYQIELREAKNSSIITPEDATRRLVNECEMFIAPFAADMEAWLRITDHLTKALQDLLHTNPAGLVSQDTMRAYAKTFDVIEKEIQALRIFIVIAEACRTVRDNIIHDLFEVAKAEIAVMKTKVEASQDVAVKTQFHKEMSHVASALHAA